METIPLNILMVEDDEIFADLMCSIIQRLDTGDIITVAPTESKALEIYTMINFDAVFLDYHLPEMTGMDIFRRLNELHEIPYAVLMTSQGSPEIQSAALESGIDKYYNKDDLNEEIIKNLLTKIRKYRRS